MGTFEEQVDAAIAAHGQWKTRLRQAASTGTRRSTGEFGPTGQLLRVWQVAVRGREGDLPFA